MQFWIHQKNLDPSDERNRSILPQDLKTAARFVDVVAE